MPGIGAREAVAQFGALGDVLTTLPTSVKDVARAIDVVVGSFQLLASQINSYVTKFNPAVVTLYTYAVENLQATIGQKLLPLTITLTTFIENLSDAIAKVNIGPIVDALGSSLDALGKATAQTIGFLRPFIELIGDFFKGVLSGITPLISILGSILEGIGNVLEPIISLLSPFIQGLGVVNQIIGDLIALAMNPFVTILKLVGSGISYVVGVITEFLIPAFNKIIDVLEGIINAAIDFYNKGKAVATLGLGDDAARVTLNRIAQTIGADKNNARSTAARGIEISGIEEVGRKALEASAMIGGAADPASQTADNTRRSAQLLEDLVAYFRTDNGKEFADGWERQGRNVVRFFGFGGDLPAGP